MLEPAKGKSEAQRVSQAKKQLEKYHEFNEV